MNYLLEAEQLCFQRQRWRFLFAEQLRIHWPCIKFDFVESRCQPPKAVSCRGCPMGL